MNSFSSTNTEAQKLILGADFNPFPGLRPFRTDETFLFFGRDGQTEEVLWRLEKNRFVAALGASGSGKSSLIYCGLIPALQGGFMEKQGSSWNISSSRPGTDPIKNLALAVLESTKSYKEKSNEEKELLLNIAITMLLSSSKGLVNLVERLQEEEEDNFLILIDQFEELFRFSRLESEDVSVGMASAFVKLLVEATKQSRVPIFVVMTMRSDYIGDCARFPELTYLINESHYLIPQMTRDQKQEAILGPVSVGGAKISARLLQRLLNDLGDTQDQLPIMQHALMRTWEYWSAHSNDNEDVDVHHYEAIGGMAEALSQHADEAYRELTEEEKIICEKLFKALTEKGEDGRGIRRPTKLKNLAKIAETEELVVTCIVDRFRTSGRTLLMPDQRITIDSNTVIDISHESLMRVWIRCRDWVDEEFEAVKIYKRLSEAASLYQQGKASLWRPPDLYIAIQWRERFQPNLAWAVQYEPSYERAVTFLKTSQEEYEEEQRVKERLQKRIVKRTKVIALILAAATIGAIMLVIFAQLKARDAERAAIEAKEFGEKANESAKAAEEALLKAEAEQLKAEEAAKEAKLQTLLAQQAKDSAEYQKNKAIEQSRIAILAQKEAEIQKQSAEKAKEEALASAQLADQRSKEAEEQKREADNAKASADTLRFLSIAQALAVKSLQLKDPEQKGLLASQAHVFNEEYKGLSPNPDVFQGLYQAVKGFKGDDFNLMKGHDDYVRTLYYDQDISALYSAGSDGTLRKWGDESLESEVISKGNGVVRGLIISKEKNIAAIFTESGKVNIFSYPDFKIIKEIKVSNRKLWTGSFDKYGDRLFVTGQGNTIYSVDIESFAVSEFAKVKDQINKILVSNLDGSLWAMNSKGSTSKFCTDNSCTETVVYADQGVAGTALAFSEDGKMVALGFEDGKLILWDRITGSEIDNLQGHDTRVTSLKFDNERKRLVSTSLDGSARIWNVTIGKTNESPIILNDLGSWASEASFANHGNTLYVGTSGHELRRYALDIPTLSENVCSLMPRKEMTDKEWNRYVGEGIENRNVCSGENLN
ncbi:nSTAND1 domain-containing NTPase [Flammeovirga kamogawensis]|uniref:Novel STAND NTPase 1 domain-containing protein n=1 Tax=Flammeovirga kamogawensis TaxID=373891 RepID=A0ABX8GV61_9BACT|nr:hypothetical protein [Flammeovirga kamogawensis]MBB6461586.1 energy-coupling factor transporter ATP-binding protein EcfA2/outer membrane biosynthesis protein TonB [Flammeovirga kamogawensis]QWG07483.1 hypothetical protein KM029_00685 [Flammeovirga kamogawensis]TRX69296.1 hypothetical protein EO216_14630 [Flammeovirga kamogawensis]